MVTRGWKIRGLCPIKKVSAPPLRPKTYFDEVDSSSP